MADDADPGGADARWAFLRDVGVFQLKLGLDALRDVLLSPVALGAALLDLVTGGERPGHFFYGVIAMGRRSEVWINLFGEHGGHGTPPATPGDGASERALAARRSAPTVDGLVAQLERLVVEQYERGGITAQAKDAIDRSLDRLGGSRPR